MSSMRNNSQFGSLPRRALKTIYCLNKVLIKNPCAYRVGPNFWDVEVHPKNVTSSVARDASYPELPIVTVRVELPPGGRDEVWVERAADKIIKLEDSLCLAVMEVAMDIGGRKIICPKEFTDIYSYSAVACHEYFYNRRLPVGNIYTLEDGNVIITSKKDNTGRFYVFKEWGVLSDSPSSCVMEAKLGIVVYPSGVLGIKKSESKELIKK